MQNVVAILEQVWTVADLAVFVSVDVRSTARRSRSTTATLIPVPQTMIADPISIVTIQWLLDR